jgi:hypothetical protein
LCESTRSPRGGAAQAIAAKLDLSVKKDQAGTVMVRRLTNFPEYASDRGMKPMHWIFYVLIMALGTWIFVDLYVFRFDELTEQELVRYSFYWVPLVLFGLLGLLGSGIRRISNPPMFASV